MTPLLLFPTGAWQVPGAVPVGSLPPEVQLSLARVIYMAPKPVVTSDVMNQTQFSMIAPDLPWVHDL